MARLNRKSTKAAIVKLLKKAEDDRGRLYSFGSDEQIESVQFTLLTLAKELELDIQPEEYK